MTVFEEPVADQCEHRRGAMSVLEFCAWASIGRTAAYGEIKAGRLRAKKRGSRTIITFEDARQWLKDLPSKSLGQAGCIDPCSSSSSKNACNKPQESRNGKS